MIVLDATTKKLQVLLGGAVTTNQLNVVSNFVDITTTTFVPGEQDANTSGATPVDIVSAPAASTQRQVKLISIYNADTVSQTVTVRYNDNATLYPLVSVALASGSTLSYVDAQGWQVITNSGATPASGTLPDPVTVAHGGTGLVTLTLHSLQVGNGASSPTQLGLGTSTTVLHGAAAGDPTWGAVVLTTDVSGILPTANGGTGIAFFTAAGPTVARVYTFPDAACTILTTNAAVTVAQGGTGLATLTIHAVYVGNGVSAPTALAVGATNTVLHGNTGADPSWSAVVEADITLANNTTNDVSTTKHGFAPIAPNDATKFLNGANPPAWAVPAGGGGGEAAANAALRATRFY